MYLSLFSIELDQTLLIFALVLAIAGVFGVFGHRAPRCARAPTSGALSPSGICAGFATLLAFAPALAALPGEDAPSPTGPVAFYETATVRERSLTTATATVTILDRQAIEESGAVNLAEVLAFVPGLSLTSNGTRGGITVAQIRGGDPNFTLVLLDGVPLNDGTYQMGGVFNFEALPTAAIERVEIVRGPLSAFYGSTGLAGAIHIVTREAAAEETEAAVKVTAGDASYQGASAEIAGRLGRGDYFLSLSTEGEEARIAQESHQLVNVQTRAGLEFGRHSKARLALRIASWEGDDYPEASGGPLFGSGELRRADNEELSLGLDLSIGDPSGLAHRVTAGLYRHELERTSPAVFPLVPASTEKTGFSRARLGWAASVERLSDPASSNGNAPSRKLRFSVGANLEHERGDNESVLLLPPFLGGDVAGTYSLDRTNPGVFAELLAERGLWAFELGARFDAPDSAASQFSPRLGVSVRPGGGPTRLRASAGRAFKLPSFFALASPPALGGNPGLRPEVSVGGDLGLERSFAGSGVTCGATLFINRFRELVDFDFVSFSHVNRSQVEARGAEFELAWRPGRRFSLAANSTWQEVEDRLSGGPLRQRPSWVGGLRFDWRPRPGLELHLDGRGVSSAFDEQIPVPDRSSIRGRTVWGARTAWSASPRFRVEARLDNLFDERYETMIGFPGPSRSARLSLRYGSDARAGGDG